jgi:hypothetical protein
MSAWWILIIIFGVICICTFGFGAFSTFMYRRLNGKCRYVRTYKDHTGKEVTETERFDADRIDAKNLSAEEYARLKKIYDRMERWSKMDDNAATCYSIGGFICCILLICLLVAIINPLNASREIAYWTEFAPMAEELVASGTDYQTFGIMESIIEYNTWLADARSRLATYGKWSGYYGKDLSQLEYIRVGQ